MRQPKINLKQMAMLVIAVAIAGCNKAASTSTTAAVDTGVAATVNGEPISMADYETHTGIKQTAQIMSPQGVSEVRLAGSFGLQSMVELVDQKILMDIAKEHGVTPTEKDIDDELAFQTKLRPDYESELMQQGLSKEMIRQELRIGLAREHLIMRGVTITQTDVDNYIKKYPAKFMEPARATVLYIQASSVAKEALIDKELAKGTRFGEVAKLMSEAPHAKETGGVYNVSAIPSMPKPVQDIVNKTNAGQASAWTKFGSSFFKFFVDKKTAAVAKQPTPEQRELIRRSLAMGEGQVKNGFDEEFYKKLKEAKVEISVPYLKDPWKASWNQLSAPNSSQAPRRK